MKTTIGVVGVALFLSGTVITAWAGSGQPEAGGALSQTTNAVGAQTGTTGRASGSSSARSSAAQPQNRQSGPAQTRENSNSRQQTRCVNCPAIAGARAGAKAKPARPWRTTIAVGAQRVENSDGAVRIEVRGQSRWFGFGVEASRYFEQAPGVEGSHDVFLDIWVASGRLRMLVFPGLSGTTSLWLRGGVVGTNSSQFESLGGFAIGADIEHARGRRFVVRGSARQYFFDPGVRSINARELKLQMDWYHVTLGYRGFAFTGVGEVLHGPEIGVYYSF